MGGKIPPSRHGSQFIGGEDNFSGRDSKHYLAWTPDPFSPGCEFMIANGLRITRRADTKKIMSRVSISKPLRTPVPKTNRMTGRRIVKSTNKSTPNAATSITGSNHVGGSAWMSNKNEKWCDETKAFVNKKKIIKMKGIGTRLLRDGDNKYSFIMYPWRGYTAVRIYRKKDTVHMATKFFDGTPPASTVAELLFDKAEYLKTLRKTSKTPIKATLRHGIVSEEDFDNLFQENTFVTSKYQKYKNSDTALKSMAKLVTLSDFSQEFEAGTTASVMSKCEKAIANARRAYNGEYPCVEVCAVWLNIEPETLLVHEDYDSWEPNHYYYHIYKNRHDMLENPL